METRYVRVLLACNDNTFTKWRKSPVVGRLLTPQLQTTSVFHSFTGVDNCAFSDWQPVRFRRMLLRYRNIASKPKWVACPDVVGNCVTTRSRFDNWYPILNSLGYSVAYVLQDRQELENIPWDMITAVFLGGSTEYKLSSEALELCSIAKQRRKLVHIGRVNSVKRVEKFMGVMDSLDGLSYSFFSDTHLPGLIEYLKSNPIRSHG